MALSVRARILLGFSLMIVILLVIVGGALWLTRENQLAHHAAEHDTRQAQLLQDVGTATTTQLAAILLYISTGEESTLESIPATERRAVAAIAEYLEITEHTGESTEGLQALVAQGLAITSKWNQAITLRSEGDAEAATALVATTLGDTSDLRARFGELNADERAQAAARSADADATEELVLWMLLTSGAMGFAVALGTGYLVSRSVLRPVDALQKAAHRVSAGDLGARAPVDGPRELAAVGAAFNEMTEALLDASKRRELEAEREGAFAQLEETHARLAETSSRLNGLLASIDDVIYAVTPNTFQVLFINQAVNQLYGRPASDFKEKGTLWLEIVHPDDLAAAKELNVRVHERGYAEGEYRIFRPDGEVRWVRARTRLVTDEHGSPVRIDGINTDITDLKRAQKDREERIKEITALHRVSNILQERDKPVGEALQAVAEVLPGAWQYREITVARIEYGGESFTSDGFRRTQWMQTATFRTADGEGFVEVCYLEPRPDEDEGPFLTEERDLLTSIAEMIGVYIDKRKSEEKIAFQAHLLDEVGQAVIATDPSGAVTYWGRAAEELYGWSREEALGRFILELTPADIGPLDGEELMSRVQRGEKWSGEVTLHRKDGTAIPVLLVDAPILDAEGRLSGIIGVAMDITDRKEAEEALRISEEQHRQAVDNSPSPIFAVDQEGRIEKWNKACESVLGYGQEVIGRPYHDLLSNQEEREKFDELISQVFSGARVHHEEISFRGANGSDRYMVCRLYSVTGPGGHNRSCIISNTDITQRKLAEEALMESESRWRSLVENTPDIIITMDRDGSIQYINKVEEGYERDAVIGTDGYQYVEEEHRESLRRAVEQAFDAVSTSLAETSTLAPDGSRRWYLTRVCPVVRNDKTVAATVVASDITEQRQAQDALRASEERFRALFEFAPDGYYLMDFEGRFVDGNKVAEELTGYKRAELTGRNFVETGLIQKENVAKAAELFAKSLAGEETGPDELELQRKDGTTTPVEIRTLPLEIDGVKQILGIARDITERRRADEMMRHLVYHDPLTSLPNRVLFEDRARVALAQAERNGRKVGIVSMDVDRLKLINDTYGHPVGDDLLKSVALRLAASIREGDTVARVGGDEFMALLNGCSTVEDGRDVASRLVAAFDTPFLLEGQDLRVTVSVGLSMFPDHGPDLRDLIKKADRAMYKAKGAGRNDYRVYSRGEDEPAKDAPEPATAGEPERS